MAASLLVLYSIDTDQCQRIDHFLHFLIESDTNLTVINATTLKFVKCFQTWHLQFQGSKTMLIKFTVFHLNWIWSRPKELLAWTIFGRKMNLQQKWYWNVKTAFHVIDRSLVDKKNIIPLLDLKFCSPFIKLKRSILYIIKYFSA